MDLENLLQALSEYLLDSGFRDPYARFQQLEHNLDDLREALRRILEEGDFFDEDTQRQLKQMAAEGTLDELIDKLIERMQQENYISSTRPPGETSTSQVDGQVGDERAKSDSKSRTRAWTFWASRRCGICLAHWANRASVATTRGTGLPGSK
jgi:Ca-activated chloride channel family protein